MGLVGPKVEPCGTPDPSLGVSSPLLPFPRGSAVGRDDVPKIDPSPTSGTCGLGVGEELKLVMGMTELRGFKLDDCDDDDSNARPC